MLVGTVTITKFDPELLSHPNSLRADHGSWSRRLLGGAPREAAVQGVRKPKVLSQDVARTILPYAQ
jgi:hypothetical protein